MQSNLKSLYEKAIEIEKLSQSPRLKLAHSRLQFCQVSLGTYYPETTKYMFVSLNPGGEYYLSESQDAIQSCQEHLPFAQYLEYTFPYARNIRKIISAFVEGKEMESSETINLFGTTDLSFFHSKTSGELKESFFIEVKESLPILIEELSIKNLDTLIFSGVSQEHFFYNLYKPGSAIKNYLYKNTGQDWMISFKTNLINDREYYCFFITHLSATRGLKTQTLVSIGHELANILE